MALDETRDETNHEFDGTYYQYMAFFCRRLLVAVFEGLFLFTTSAQQWKLWKPLKMAGIEDGGRCLMDEINALFAPPGRGEAKSRKQELHPYFKRPGKGHNHDCCDACGEGGDLICCDSCPASFHFTCHCPPLEEEDIPLGDWVCLRCYYKEQARATTAACSKLSLETTDQPASEAVELNTDTNMVQVDVSPIATPSKPSGRGRGGRGGNRRQHHPEKTETEKVVKIYRLKYDKYLKLKPTTNSPFDALIKATQVMNAEQFKLPDELNPHEQLPYSWKWKDERQDEQDSVFMKNCINCSKSSRGVPSVTCDFCSSVYHLDCLDPPLCEIPSERWMCPNHVEQYIDSKLVTSTRLSERLALWKKYAKNPINVETVRMEFFRKVRSGKLFQRSKTLKAQKPDNLRIKVPDFVKAAYANRTTGFPPHVLHEYQNKKVSQNLDEDQEEWLRSLVSLQASLAKDSSEEAKPSTEEKKKENSKVAKKAKKEADNDGDSTDSECDLELDIEDEISADAQEELARYLARNGHNYGTVAKLSPQIRDFLALQRLNTLFDKVDKTPQLNIRARAALIPLDLKDRSACPISFRTFKVGLGSSVDLDLSRYGKCHCISKFHASIFFDQYSRVYELLNYSEHGTVVDNVIYSGDVTLHSMAATQAKDLKVMSKDAMKSPNDDFACFCSTSPSEVNMARGCEVPAALHHGSYVRFGCMQFIFSILTYANEVESNNEFIAMKEEKKEEEGQTNMD